MLKELIYNYLTSPSEAFGKDLRKVLRDTKHLMFCDDRKVVHLLSESKFLIGKVCIYNGGVSNIGKHTILYADKHPIIYTTVNMDYSTFRIFTRLCDKHNIPLSRFTHWLSK